MNADGLDPSLREKFDNLRAILSDMQEVLVAFSGGVDSTFLLAVAHDVLGDGVTAVTATSAIHPGWETQEAEDFARGLNVRHLLIRSDEMDNPAFTGNPPDRCYICKKTIFSRLLQLARERGIPYVVDGANVGDDADYRPGSRATAELGIRSPLKEAGLDKPEIRRLSRLMELPTWEKPAWACLASRFPYETEITPEALKQVGRAEEHLRSLGLTQVRVRHHGALARIEVLPEDIHRLASPELRERITSRLRELGYAYVALDLVGYRTGSLNEILQKA